jgi:two-component system sensor histidine kinase VicK
VKLYFLSPISENYREDFYNQMRQQNVKAMHVVSLFLAASELLIYFSAMFIDYGSMIKSFDRYYNVCVYFLVISLIFAGIFTFIKKGTQGKDLWKYNVLAILYASLVIAGNIWLSFIAQGNPKNSLTMLMMSMLLIAALMVLTLGETFLITIPCFIVFTFGLKYFQTNMEFWITNYLVFCFILIGFLGISRLLYSYHVNYFIKVKTIEDKTIETIQANESKTEILSIVAHDLRSPIANIQTLVEMMQSTGQTDAEKMIYLEHIRDCCEKANSTIRDIITAAKEDRAGMMIVTRESLNDLLLGICNGWQRS